MIGTKKRIAALALIAVCLVLAACGGAGNIISAPAAGTPGNAGGAWSFAVMGDTQWTVPDSAGKNPNTVADPRSFS